MSFIKKHIVGVLFTLVAGAILHFAYEWSGNNLIVAMLAPINESVWEHLKILVTPMLFYFVIEYFTYGKKTANFVPVRVLSIIIGMLVIIVSYYTYSGIIGSKYLVADIGTFVLGTLVAYWASYKMLQSQYFGSKKADILGWIGLVFLIFIVIIFTFSPPHIALFKDFSTGAYGLI
ncbi:hypothetical protein EHE19_014545 [Ruminiclostridium herbifermentans]|uniref:Uncharacterized protein n=1 Tax=Ruminiclostridium herbifermentans TaxID=2488810 RepID=A0A4U7JHC0_9FIRM|nr:DUF6512 family protein [Ruminiclostridium herbifermentans]QNU66090.1 hypothetical protein EHE19_014545 [Ruminiclostridium herbifermentans]